MRVGSSVVTPPLLRVSENPVSTSYGVAGRSRARLEARSSHACTGANASATTAVASTDRAGLGESVRPMSSPPPSTITT